jgi:hypothetical protein
MNFVDRIEKLPEDTSFALFPDDPVHQNDYCVEVTPSLLWRPLSRPQPPLFSTAKVFTRNREICPCPVSEPVPNLPAETAVNEIKDFPPQRG